MSRREALGRVATGLGIASVFNVGEASLGAAQRATGAPAARRTTVQTVLGPIDSSKLGFTLSHEHINASSAGIWQAWPELLGGRARFVATAVDQLKRAKDEGVASIIDCTTIDLGRDIRLMEEISRKSGMQVIAATGHWLDPSNTMRARTVEELADFFVREITVGIEGTGIKAGIIKVANGAMIDPFGEKLLRAASRASKATGLPVTTHSPGAQRVGEKQALIFEEEASAPRRSASATPTTARRTTSPAWRAAVTTSAWTSFRAADPWRRVRRWRRRVRSPGSSATRRSKRSWTRALPTG